MTSDPIRTAAEQLGCALSLALQREGFCHSLACCEFTGTPTCPHCTALVDLIEVAFRQQRAEAEDHATYHELRRDLRQARVALTAAEAERSRLRAALEAMTEERDDWKLSFQAANDHVGKLQND